MVVVVAAARQKAEAVHPASLSVGLADFGC